MDKTHPSREDGQKKDQGTDQPKGDQKKSDERKK